MKRLALSLSLVLSASSAAAAPSGNQAVEDAAKVRYAEGVKLYNKRRYEEARVAFLQASALMKRPSATLMLAQSALKSGRWLEASRAFDEFMATAAEVPDKIKEVVEKGRRDARAHLGSLKLDLPDGAEATVDGEKVETKDLVTVAAGPHTVVVTHRDEKKTIEVEAPAGKTTEVRPSFVPKAIIPTADTRTRPKEAPVPSPSPATTTQKEESSIFTPPETTWPMYAAGAVGVGGLVTAAIFGGLAANARHGVDVANETIARNAPGARCTEPTSFENAARGTKFEQFAGTCATLRTQEKWASAHQGVFTTSLVVGLAGMAGAITWFLVAPRPGSTEKGKEKPVTESVIVPWVSPLGAGATFEGRF